jgi:hypothetical protein
MRIQAYVINLAHRTDRWNNMLQHWPEFELYRYNGIMLPKDGRPYDRIASEGLGLTHMQLLKEAAARGEKTVLIMEDDALPVAGWYEKWIEQKEWLDGHLDQWDVCNGGSFGLIECHNILKLKKSFLIRGERACAGHFLYLNLNALDEFLKWPSEKIDIDMYYCNVFTKRFKLHCSYPLMAIQDDGFSDIIQENRDWSLTLLMNEAKMKQHLGNLFLEYNQTSSPTSSQSP